MADFKKGSHEFNLPTTAGGQLALKHRKYIIAGTMDSDTFIIRDEDTGTTNTLTPSKNSEYVTASICLHAPTILNCFVQNGIIKSTSQSSIIPYYLNTSNVEFISYTNWSIKFSYGGKNFALAPLNGKIICSTTSLYRHAISLALSSNPTFFNIYFDIINNYGKPYVDLSDVKDAIKLICDNNSLDSITLPCSGYYYKYNSEGNYFPYGNPDGFVTNIVCYGITQGISLNCNVSSLYKDVNNNYQQIITTHLISTANVYDTVQLLA